MCPTISHTQTIEHPQRHAFKHKLTLVCTLTESLTHTQHTFTLIHSQNLFKILFLFVGIIIEGVLFFGGFHDR